MNTRMYTNTRGVQGIRSFCGYGILGVLGHIYSYIYECGRCFGVCSNRYSDDDDD